MYYKNSFILRVIYSLFSFFMLLISSNEYLSIPIKVAISILYAILMFLVIKREKSKI